MDQSDKFVEEFCRVVNKKKYSLPLTTQQMMECALQAGYNVGWEEFRKQAIQAVEAAYIVGEDDAST